MQNVHFSANWRFCLQVKILSGLMSLILHISGNLSPKFFSGSGTRISGLSEQLTFRKSVPKLFVRTSEISGLSEPGLTNHHCIYMQKCIYLLFMFSYYDYDGIIGYVVTFNEHFHRIIVTLKFINISVSTAYFCFGQSLQQKLYYNTCRRVKNRNSPGDPILSVTVLLISCNS